MCQWRLFEGITHANELDVPVIPVKSMFATKFPVIVVTDSGTNTVSSGYSSTFIINPALLHFQAALRHILIIG